MTGVREDLVKVVHGDPEKYTAVIFTGSGTIVQDVLVNSLVPEGKKMCVVNNGAYAARMVEIAKYYNIDCVDVQSSTTGLPDLDAVKKAIEEDKEIAVVAAVHHETGTGVLNPVRKIGRIAHDNDCIFIVDSISTYGLRPLDIEEENIDFLMSSAQKGLAAMTGASWAVGNIKAIEKSKDYPTRSYYCNLFMQYDFFNRVGEMHFTPPVQTIYALAQALKEYFEEGELNRWDRLKKCWEAIHKGLEEIGLGYVIDKKIQGKLVVTVEAPDDGKFDFATLHDYCFERGFTIYPGKMFGLKTFRLCNLGLITHRDIEDFFVTAKEAFMEMGYSLPLK
jgi:2-aminoethylphosphonate-pyruvate transaminase